MKLILSAILLLANSHYYISALRCFTCDNNAYGEDCITNPASVGISSICQSPNDEYCYTSRVEEQGNKITLNRGCCRVIENSPVCPPGANFQEHPNEIPPFTKYLTRCTGDLCNDSEGDNSSGGSGGGSGGGSLVVEGKAPKNANKPSAATGGGTTVYVTWNLVLSMMLLLFWSK